MTGANHQPTPDPPTRRAGIPLGIDGCRGGWVWCACADGRWQGGVVARLLDLPAWLGVGDAPPGGADLGPALIDMPIGLPDGGRAERDCDRLARALLGRPRSSSVFRVPVRAVLDAVDYADACARSRARAGVALSKQAWHLVPRMRELDRLLGGSAVARARLHEGHPELCLWGLAGGRPMHHAKRTAAGQAERLDLLRALAPEAAALAVELAAHGPRRRLALDDAIDAAVLAVSAGRLDGPAGRRLPSVPPRDAMGLPMALRFADLGAAESRPAR